MPDDSNATLVDIGIPTVRSPLYLTQALDSVLAQTFSRWRLTISDNGGGNAAEVVAPYLEDPRISYRPNTTILDGTYGALAGNWSGLIAEATAPYVALLHDDDWWEPGWLERRVEFFARHPECGLVYGPHVDVDSSGTEILRARVALDEGVYPPAGFVSRFVRDKDVHPSPPSVIVRRDAYEAVEPRFNPDFAMCDSEMWLRLALRFPVGYLTVHDAYYRVHGQSLSAAAKWGESWIAYQEQVEGLLKRELPAAAFTPAESRERRSSAHLSAAMDSIAQRRRRDALAHLRAAARIDRRSVLDPRVPLALAVLPFGERGARLLQRIRGVVARKDIRVPFVRPH